MTKGLVIVILFGLAIIIAALLIVIILMMKNEKENVKKAKAVVSNASSLPNVLNLPLPSTIESIAKSEVLGIVQKIYESFKIFDYQNMDLFELDKKEWHTWQVSFLLMLYKNSEELFIANQEEVFHPFLLNSNENDVKGLMRSIVNKYKNYVNINQTKDFLSKEYIWSNKDVSIIFYFLANYKNYKN